MLSYTYLPKQIKKIREILLESLWGYFFLKKFNTAKKSANVQNIFLDQ